MTYTKEWLQDNILTTSEVSKCIKTSPVQVRNIIKAGKLKPVLVASSRFFILKQDVADYIKDNPYVGRTNISRESISVKAINKKDRECLSSYLSNLISMFDAAKKYPIGVHNLKYLTRAGSLTPVFSKEKTEFFEIEDIESILQKHGNATACKSIYDEGYQDGYADCKKGMPAKILI